MVAVKILWRHVESCDILMEVTVKYMILGRQRWLLGFMVLCVPKLIMSDEWLKHIEYYIHLFSVSLQNIFINFVFRNFTEICQEVLVVIKITEYVLYQKDDLLFKT